MADERPGGGSVEERRELLEAERSALPFLAIRAADGAQHIVRLGEGVDRVVIGRRDAVEVSIDWDERVSRIHAELELVGTEWAISDDGLSRNGTFVNERRVTSRRRLRDHDVIRVGHTTIVFRDPSPAGESRATVPGSRAEVAPAITPSQQRVLEALCRPCLVPGSLGTPATNETIASELYLTVDAVKAHLRQLFRRFDVDALPQIQKRTALVRIAIESGIVRRSS
jgi:DNA-binding CsgD family transcriptional regulator